MSTVNLTQQVDEEDLYLYLHNINYIINCVIYFKINRPLCISVDSKI